MSWINVPLSECCDIVSGSTPRRDVAAYWEGHIPWVTPKDISELNGAKILEDAPECITNEGYKACSTRMLPKGSVLFSSRAPIGLVAVAGRDMCTNQGFKSLLPHKNVDSNYLYYCMKWMAPQIAEMGNGATFKEVSKSTMEKIGIPLPPLEEQKRIAAILDKADDIRRKRAESLKLLDELLRATFLDLFGDPIANPKDWPVMSMDTVANKITDGEHLNPAFVNEGVPMIMANNVRAAGIGFDDVKFVSYQDYTKFSQKCRPQFEDLLLVSRGATIGRSCLVNTDREFCLMGSVILIKPNITKVLSEYISGCFSQENFVKKLTKASGSSAQQAIYLKDLKNVKLPVPPTGLQRNFSAIYQKILNGKNTHLKSQTESDTLFHSLVARAFKGKL